MSDDAVIKSFMVGLGFRVNQSEQKNFTTAIASVTTAAAGMAAALAAAAVAAALAVTKIAAGFDTLYFSSQRTGASVQNIKSLQYAFSQVGSSSEAAASAIEAYAKAVRTNPGVGQYVKDLGVKQTGDAFNDLSAAIDKIQAKNPHYVGAQMAGILGLSEEQYLTFTKYRKERLAFQAEYEKTSKQFRLNNEEAAKSSNSFMTGLRSLGMVASVVGEKFLVMLAPAFDRVVKGILSWIDANPEKIEAIFNAIAKAGDWLAGQFKEIWDKGVQLFDYLSAKAKEMDEDGSFLRMWEKVASVFERVVGAIKGVLTWLGELDRATDMSGGLNAIKRLLGWAEGKTAGFAQAGADAANSLDRATDTGVGVPSGKAERGGIFTRAKRALGIGTSASDASGGIKRGGGNAEGARESYTFWRGKGLTHEQAAGLVGMEQGESQFNPKARGDSGLAHGAFQHHPDRRAAIKKALGIDISNASHREQLEAAHWEMTKGGERGFWDRIKQATTPGEAAATGVRYFERPKDIAGESRLRGQYANSWAARFAGSPVVQSQANPQTTLAPPMPKGFSPGGFDVNRLGAAPMGASTVNNTTGATVTMSPVTNIKIDGAGDPASVGAAVERAQGRANDNSLRNAQSAIR